MPKISRHGGPSDAARDAVVALDAGDTELAAALVGDSGKVLYDNEGNPLPAPEDVPPVDGDELERDDQGTLIIQPPQDEERKDDQERKQDEGAKVDTPPADDSKAAPKKAAPAKATSNNRTGK